MISFLLIEDRESDVELIRYWARHHYPDCSLRNVWDRATMEAALTEGLPDVYLCDYALPTFPWPGAFELARERDDPLKPFIVLSGMVKDDKGIKAITARAEYVSKDELETRLKTVVDLEIKMYQARIKTRSIVSTTKGETTK